MGVFVLLREESVERVKDGICLSCVAGIILMRVFFRVWAVLVVLWA